MRIDLFYYTPYLNDYYFVYGPEKDSNGDIYIKGTGYYFADVNDMKAKLNSMTASLAPEITNVQPRTQGNSFWIYVGDLNTSSSDVPDYTQVLTNINTNLTNLNDKFKIGSTNVINITQMLQTLAGCFTSNPSNSDNAYRKSVFSLNYSGQDYKSLTDLFYKFIILFTRNNPGAFTDSYFRNSSSVLAILNSLSQSVTPNANITDVISALNTTIDSKQDTTIVNNEVTPLAEINIDVPFEVKNLNKSDVEL